MKITPKTTTILTFLTALIFSVMLVISFKTGANQQFFEFVHSSSVYVEKLLAQSRALRLIIFLDNIFIILYMITTYAVVQIFLNENQQKVSKLIITMVFCAGALDYLENFHILSLLRMSEVGETFNMSDVKFQMVASMIKWHLAYLSFILIGLAFKAHDLFEKAFKYICIFCVLPIGTLVYTELGSQFGVIAFNLRYLNLLSGFIIFGIILIRRKEIFNK